MAIHYILDGNNILKSTPEFLDAADRNFMNAQQELVVLSAKALVRKPLGDLLEVVFDGSGFNYRFAPPANTRVIFSKGRTADEIINDKIKATKEQWIKGQGFEKTVVVSDDREIRECARLYGASVWRTREFAGKIFPPKAAGRDSRAAKQPEKDIDPAHRQKITKEMEKHYGIK